MLQGIGKGGIAQAAIEEGATGPGAATTSGDFQKDATESSTAPRFGELLQKIQGQYGAKPAKQREIRKTLGKDDFLRIMITQMQHQDPTSPFKAEQMAQEMAQFTSVEQLQNMNHNLGKLATRDQPMERLAMTGLIGRTVIVDRGRFPHVEGASESLGFTLPAAAAKVKVAVVSEKGEIVLQKELGPHKAGDGEFSWDGLKSNNLPAATGNYLMRVEAYDDKGIPLQTDSRRKVRVVGVSFEGPEPVFLVGDARHQDRVTMRNISRIDENSDPGARPPSARPAPRFGEPAPGAASAPAPTSFAGAPFAAAPLAGGQTIARTPSVPANSAAAGIAAGNMPGNEPENSPENDVKGFPNGLHD